MIMSLLVASLCVALNPLLGQLTFCHIAMFFLGGTFGLIEVGSNGWIIGIWQEKSATVFQFFNFCFGLGGVVAPLVAEPFLSKVHSRWVNFWPFRRRFLGSITKKNCNDKKKVVK